MAAREGMRLAGRSGMDLAGRMMRADRRLAHRPNHPLSGEIPSNRLCGARSARPAKTGPIRLSTEMARGRRARWHVEPRWGDCVRRTSEQSDLPDLRLGRNRDASHDVQGRSRNLYAVLATVSARRAAFRWPMPATTSRCPMSSASAAPGGRRRTSSPRVIGRASPSLLRKPRR